MRPEHPFGVISVKNPCTPPLWAVEVGTDTEKNYTHLNLHPTLAQGFCIQNDFKANLKMTLHPSKLFLKFSSDASFLSNPGPQSR